jgi:anti-sigma factor RsiW
MKMKSTKCDELVLAEMLFEPEAASEQVKAHVAACEGCSKQLAELQATMGLLDEWKAAEPSPYFMTRMNARLEEERNAAPAGFFERMRARFAYGPRHAFRPVAAMALTVMLLVGGGAYVGFSGVLGNGDPTSGHSTAVVHDLQNLDSNAQLLDQLEAMSNAQDNSNSGD